MTLCSTMNSGTILSEQNIQASFLYRFVSPEKVHLRRFCLNPTHFYLKAKRLSLFFFPYLPMILMFSQVKGEYFLNAVSTCWSIFISREGLKWKDHRKMNRKLRERRKILYDYKNISATLGQNNGPSIPLF